MFTEALVRWWRGVVLACVEAVGVNHVCVWGGFDVSSPPGF